MMPLMDGEGIFAADETVPPSERFDKSDPSVRLGSAHGPGSAAFAALADLGGGVIVQDQRCDCAR
jgi:hypothetical protein